MAKLTGFLITSKGWGGLEINVLRLAQWLSQNGVGIILYTVPSTRLFKEAQSYNLTVVAINEHRKYFDFINAFNFGRILKQHSVRNLMIFDNKDLDFANLVKLSLYNNLRLIYQQHMQLGISKRDLLHTFRFSGLDYWISPLEWLKQQVLKHTHVKKEKIKVIPLGVEIQNYIIPSYAKSEARHKLQLNREAIIIGIVGRIDPLKGQFFLVQAIKQIRSLNFPVELLIVGEPTINETQSLSYFESIQEYILQENLSHAIHIRGYTSNVELAYQAIDIFALASKAETYGMVTIEAMLSGVPIIATNAAGTPEILQYGKLGTLYIPNDLTDFCQKLIYMISHLKESIKQASESRSLAMDVYSHQRECQLIEQLLVD
jgi:glycosyltransferase involved in cell wall biosynthesis